MLTNTNKLMKQYAYATGLKTGSTSKAGCCLSGTANKDGIDLIAVVMAAPTSKIRFSDAITLLNYGFSVCSIYKDEEPLDTESIKISSGRQDKIKITKEKDYSYMFINKYNNDDIRRECIINDNIKAPLKEGDEVGVIKYYYNEAYIGSVKIISCENVDTAGFMDTVKKIFKSLL